MAIAMTLKKYLADQGVDYDVVSHDRTMSATRTAQTSHVSGEFIAKAVLLKAEGGFLLAVVPATHHIQLSEVKRCTGKPVAMATEEDVAKVFSDCDIGAIPPTGDPYGLSVVMDDRLAGNADVYFEGGDHASLIHVKGEQFKKLMANAQHARFSLHD